MAQADKPGLIDVDHWRDGGTQAAGIDRRVLFRRALDLQRGPAHGIEHARAAHFLRHLFQRRLRLLEALDLRMDRRAFRFGYHDQPTVGRT
jgi:hypothetical protein